MKRSIFLVLTMLGLLVWGSQVQARSVPFVGKELGAVPVKEETMGHLRGGYMGFFFQVVFEGFWDTTGRQWARVNVQGNFGNTGRTFVSGDNPSPTTVESSSNEDSVSPQVRSTAVLGGFKGGRGIFQINQVPGSGNIVRNGLIINIYLLNQPVKSPKSSVYQSINRLLLP